MRIVLLLILFLSNTVLAKQLKIAVLDTGYTVQPGFKSINLCQKGHADTSNEKITDLLVPAEDTHWSLHGTNVAHIIDDALKGFGKTEYCIIIIRFYNEKNRKANFTKNTVLALKHALELGVDYINYSAGGPAADKEERAVIKQILNKNIKIIAAAGNSGLRLTALSEAESDKKSTCAASSGCPQRTFQFYPALYDHRIITVGSLNSTYKIAKSSNYGDYVYAWEIGENVSAGGVILSGTSQAAAVRTGKIVKAALEKRVDK